MQDLKYLKIQVCKMFYEEGDAFNTFVSPQVHT